VPSRNALLADAVPAFAYGFERAVDNLGAIVGPLLALGLVGLVGVRTAILLSVIPGLLAVAAIVYAIRHPRDPNSTSASRSGCGSGPSCAASSAASWGRSGSSRWETSPRRC
jgi:MFS family permease